MFSPETQQRLYQARLSRWTRQFAHGLSDLRPGELDRASSLSEVRLFVEENLDKRRQKLATFCGLLGESCPELERHLDDYVRHVQAEPCGAARVDSLRFLIWLEAHRTLTDEQRDCLVCERSRLEVEERARRNRMAYVRFAELQSVVDRQIECLERGDDRTLLLDPTRIRAILCTHLFVGDDAAVPANVLFHAVNQDLRTCLLDDGALEVLDELEQRPGCTFCGLANALPATSPGELLERCRELAAHGVLAVA